MADIVRTRLNMIMEDHTPYANTNAEAMGIIADELNKLFKKNKKAWNAYKQMASDVNIVNQLNEAWKKFTNLMMKFFKKPPQNEAVEGAEHFENFARKTLVGILKTVLGAPLYWIATIADMLLATLFGISKPLLPSLRVATASFFGSGPAAIVMQNLTNMGHELLINGMAIVAIVFGGVRYLSEFMEQRTDDEDHKYLRGPLERVFDGLDDFTRS